MISFKQFLAEEAIVPWKEVPLTASASIKMINEYCVDALNCYINNNIVLYRGFAKGGKQINSTGSLINTSGSYRTSKDSYNLYMLIMSFIDGIPNRSNSIICSTNRTYAGAYGNVYAVFPYDNTPIAVSDREDFFGNVVTRNIFCPETTDIVGLDVKLKVSITLLCPGASAQDFKTMHDVDKLLSPFHWAQVFFMLMFQHTKYVGYNSSRDKLIKTEFLKMYDKLCNGSFKPNLLNSEDIPYMVESIENTSWKGTLHFAKELMRIAKSENRFSTLAQIMAPSITEINVHDISDITHTNSECWFSGKCVVIPIDMLKDLK